MAVVARLFLVLSSCFALVLSVGCRDPDASDSAQDAGGGTDQDAGSNWPYSAPRADLVPAVGSSSTFEMATWNIENFPKNANTPKVLADLIASLDLDMVVLEEVQDVDAFTELVERLRGYKGMVSSDTYGDGTYQKIGYIYRSDLVSLGGAFLLFTQDGYEFPRPPMKVDVVVHAAQPWSFTAIGLHLKAGGGFRDRERRKAAVVILEDYLRSAVDGNSNDKIAVLGDYNETFRRGTAVFAPLKNASDRYTFRTAGNDAAGEFSFVPSSALIDHAVTTKAFDTAYGAGMTVIPRLDNQLNNYEAQVSDHLPVVMVLAL